MSVRALVFIAVPTPAGPFRSALDAESLRSRKAEADKLPVAYAVLNKDLPALREALDDLVDRGRKNKAKGLSRLLLNRSGTPVIEGSYTSGGQLARSVRTLLLNAVKKENRNLFVIGADKPAFDELWEKSSAESPNGSGKPTGLKSPACSRSQDEAIVERILGGEKADEKFLLDYVGNSLPVRMARALAVRAAQTNAPVLILGETGTGKEVIARAIHRLSGRHFNPFIPVNCAGIPGELLESELFGHVKGAFTGATRNKKGMWEAASNGTLFLDEIGDLTPAHQAKILRTLSDGKIRRVGGDTLIHVDARVIAATNRDLPRMVQNGTFREDLYYRLRVFPIRTAPLRECKEDIQTISQVVWRKVTGKAAARLPQEILEALPAYPWMGNVRQLNGVLRHLYNLFADDGVELREFRWIMGQDDFPAPGKPAESKKDIWRHRSECLEHLRRADDLLRATKVALRPIVEKKQTDAATLEAVGKSLEQRLEEFEMLCLHPLLFCSESTFSRVYGLKGSLSYFQSLLTEDTSGVLAYWTKELSPQFKHVMHALFEEVGRISKSRTRP